MHKFDTVLKSLLMDAGNILLASVIGVAVGAWLNVELPAVNQPRVDILLRARRSRALAAVELQTANDPDMPLRMAEYALAIYRKYGQLPKLFVLYVGREPLRMPDRLVGEGFAFHYQVIDIRSFEANTLLRSPHISDAVLAILAKHDDPKQTIRQILRRIAKLEKGQRAAALNKLTLLAGLRNLEQQIDEEAKTMPATYDIMTHKLFGPAIREGLERGKIEGRIEGRTEEALSLVHRLLKARFGHLPASANAKLENLSLRELEVFAERVVTAESLSALFNYSSTRAPKKKITKNQRPARS